MASKTQLCNLALTRLRGATIVSLDDPTKTAQLCKTLFDDVAEEVMSEGSWPSTIRRQTLNKTTNVPAFEYSNEFQLPTLPRFLKVLNINDQCAYTQPFVIEGDKLLTDLSSVKIRYVAYLEDTGSWDVYLKRAFVYRLTAELAYVLTGQDPISTKWYALYERKLADCLNLAGQEGSNQHVFHDNLLDVR